MTAQPVDARKEYWPLTDRQLWEVSCLTRVQLESWTDDDFAKHAAGVRHTIKYLMQLLDGLAALRSSGTREEALEALNLRLVYVKRWRTIIPLPATYAEEIRTALSLPVPAGVREALASAETIPWKDSARQFPLYELAPDFTLFDRDPQADERLRLYRDIFAEITAKAIPICDPDSDDPERVRGYRLPVGPLHRAAGKLGFQLFDGERHLADALTEIASLRAALALPQQSGSDGT